MSHEEATVELIKRLEKAAFRAGLDYGAVLYAGKPSEQADSTAVAAHVAYGDLLMHLAKR